MICSSQLKVHHLNSIASHSSQRKVSLDMHWYVLDFVISGANCHAGKFICLVVLVKRQTHTYKWWKTHKHAKTHACSLNILRSSCEEGLLIWSNTTWKIPHSDDTVPKGQSPYSSCFQLQTFKRTILYLEREFKKSTSLKARSMSTVLYYLDGEISIRETIL